MLKYIKHPLKIVTGWFLKDSRLVIRPGIHCEQRYDVAMLTVEPAGAYHYQIQKFTGYAAATGTYGAFKPWSIATPFSTAIMLVLEQQLGIKDVTATVEAIGYHSIIILANNPTIGKPYIEIVDFNTMRIAIFYLIENEEHIWQDSTGRNFIIRRNPDSSNKEFEITVDP